MIFWQLFNHFELPFPPWKIAPCQFDHGWSLYSFLKSKSPRKSDTKVLRDYLHMYLFFLQALLLAMDPFTEAAELRPPISSMYIFRSAVVFLCFVFARQINTPFKRTAKPLLKRSEYCFTFGFFALRPVCNGLELETSKETRARISIPSLAVDCSEFSILNRRLPLSKRQNTECQSQKDK